jgi:tungstate transport system substrate-binding protein
MGATLNVAVGKGAYCLTDSSTWGAFRNKAELKAIFFGDPKLQNPYIVIVAAKSAKRKLAQKFADWLTGPEGQAIIRDFKVNGAALFIPTAPRAN